MLALQISRLASCKHRIPRARTPHKFGTEAGEGAPLFRGSNYHFSKVWLLLAIAPLLGSERSEVAEQAIVFVVRTRGEVEASGKSVLRIVSTEADRP